MVPEQSGVAFAGVVQTAQTPWHSRLPARQVKPQVLPVHVATEPGGTGQATHELPQLVTLVFETQL